MSDKLKKEKWDESYLRKGGHVFFPHEEIIRFLQNTFVNAPASMNLKIASTFLQHLKCWT